jgi:hypothetical protein
MTARVYVPAPDVEVPDAVVAEDGHTMTTLCNLPEFFPGGRDQRIKFLITSDSAARAIQSS